MCTFGLSMYRGTVIGYRHGWIRLLLFPYCPCWPFALNSIPKICQTSTHSHPLVLTLVHTLWLGDLHTKAILFTFNYMTITVVMSFINHEEDLLTCYISFIHYMRTISSLLRERSSLHQKWGEADSFILISITTSWYYYSHSYFIQYYHLYLTLTNTYCSYQWCSHGRPGVLGGATLVRPLAPQWPPIWNCQSF